LACYERMEYFVESVIRDSDSGICKDRRDAFVCAIMPGPYANSTATRHSLHGIYYDVAHHLLDLLWIAQYVGQALIRGKHELNRVAVEISAHKAIGSVDEVVQIQPVKVQLHRTREIE